MMKTLKFTVGEFLRKVGMLKNAKDSYGNRLYSDEEIAGFFGMKDSASLDKAVKDTTKKYRITLTARAKQLKGEGYPNDRIDERLGLSQGSTEILLDDEGNGRIDETINAMAEARENFTKEINHLFDNVKPFDPSFFH